MDKGVGVVKSFVIEVKAEGSGRDSWTERKGPPKENVGPRQNRSDTVGLHDPLDSGGPRQKDDY